MHSDRVSIILVGFGLEKRSLDFEDLWPFLVEI